MTKEYKPPLRKDVPVYMCECCGEVYEAEPGSFEKAEANFEANKATYEADMPDNSGQLAVVCDDCFKKFAAWFEAKKGVKLSG